MNIFVAELQAFDPMAGAVITLRYASGQGFDNDGTFIEPRIETPASIRRDLSLSIIGGRASSSYGELTLVNVDGGLNSLADLYFDGRPFNLLYGDDDSSLATFDLVLTAIIETVAIERERISVRLRDRSYLLDKPFSTVKYAGTNALPNGIEGTADDIKDQPKPRIFGRIALMQPVLVNTSKLIYQCNAGPVDAVINVFDSGAYLSRTANTYTSQSDMEANAPAQGAFKVWPAGGCFRLGSSPVGTVSCSVAERWDYLDISAAGIIKRILQEKGFTSADWAESDFDALNEKSAGPLGVIVNPEETTAALIERIAQTVGVWWGFDSTDRGDTQQEVPLMTLTEDEFIALERQPETSPPLWQITLKSDVNHAVQDRKSLAGIVNDARAAWFESESRDQKATDTYTQTARLLAEEQTVDSLFASISQAKAEADRRLLLLSDRRDTVTATLANPLDYPDIDLGSVLEIESESLGYTEPRRMMVIGIGSNFATNTLDLTLWG